MTHLAAIWYNSRMDEFHIKTIAPADFELEMLKAIHLGADPTIESAKYGLVYEHIKDLAHFKVKMEQVEKALLLEGSLTPVIAGIGLHTAVEKLAYRVQDDRIPTGDLIKAIEAFKKVRDGSKSNETSDEKQGVSLVINIPALGAQPSRTIEVTSEPDKKLREYNTIEAEVAAIEAHSESSKTSQFTIELP